LRLEGDFWARQGKIYNKIKKNIKIPIFIAVNKVNAIDKSGVK